MKKNQNLKKNILLVIGIVVGLQLLYLVALLPIYSLVGDTTKSADETEVVLRRSEIMVQSITVIAIIAVVAVSFITVKKQIKKTRSRSNGEQK